MRRPPITVKCECGESKEVPYGERWQCERCGRAWDTKQIPAAEYDGLLRRMRRYRLEAVVIGTVLAAIFIVLVALVSQTFIFLIPVVAAARLLLFLPVSPREGRRGAPGGPPPRPGAAGRRVRARAELAHSLGLEVERLRVRSPHPVDALLEVVSEREPGLLVFGPDRSKIKPRVFRRVAKKIRARATCLVW